MTENTMIVYGQRPKDNVVSRAKNGQKREVSSATVEAATEFMNEFKGVGPEIVEQVKRHNELIRLINNLLSQRQNETGVVTITDPANGKPLTVNIEIGTIGNLRGGQEPGYWYKTVKGGGRFVKGFLYLND